MTRAKLTYYLLSSLTTFLGDQSWGFAGERVEIKREKVILKLFLWTLSSSPHAGVIHITVSRLTDGVHGVQRGRNTGTGATHTQKLETRASEPRPGGLSVRPWLDQQKIRARWLPGPRHTQASVETADWPWLFFGPQRGPWQRPPRLTPPASVIGVKCRRRKRGRKVSHPEAPWSPAQCRLGRPGHGSPRACQDCTGRRARGTQVALPSAAGVARGERALAPGGRVGGGGGARPLRNPLGLGARGN